MNWNRLTHLTLGLMLSHGWLTQEASAIKFTPPPTFTLAEANLLMTPPASIELSPNKLIDDTPSASTPSLKKSKRLKSVKLGKRSKKGSKHSKKTKNHT